MLRRATKVDLEENIAKNIAMVEYYYGVQIGMDFPILKRINMQRHLQEIFELDAKRFGLMK